MLRHGVSDGSSGAAAAAHAKVKPGSDAVVIGSGPNGLAAAIVLAEAQYSVTVYEAQDTIGGGLRSAALTRSGYLHDVCSAVHPMGIASPFFRARPLDRHGLEWIQPAYPLAHPFDDGSAAVLQNDLAATCAGLGRDGRAYNRVVGHVVRQWSDLEPLFFGPPRPPANPIHAARFGLAALRSCSGLARAQFRTVKARGLFAGLAAHSVGPLDRAGTAAIGIVLAAAAHVHGWPIPRGGAQSIANALSRHLANLGGTVTTGRRIDSLAELGADLVLADVTPRGLLRLAGEKLSGGYRRALEAFRYGPGVFKVDWALSDPIPWEAAECRSAGTVHVGGTLEEIEDAERAPFASRHADRPFVLLAQPSLFDPSRAPAGRHTAWAYCHVPHGSTEDMTERIERQVERFAPGFGACIIARSARGPADLERGNENLIGGDITGGDNSLKQLFMRPTWRHYATPISGLYLCSSSTPPGGGVHGMCGLHAASLAVRRR
jgi:phytoene dehydrogenase-like protein